MINRIVEVIQRCNQIVIDEIRRVIAFEVGTRQVQKKKRKTLPFLFLFFLKKTVKNEKQGTPLLITKTSIYY